MATVHVEEVKLTGDIQDAEKMSCPESKNLEVKDEEQIKAEDSHGGKEEGSAEESATEVEAAIVSEEKVEDVKNVPIVREVEREEDVKTSDPLTGDAIQIEDISKLDAESLLAGLKEEADSSEKEVKNQVDITDLPVPPKESTEALLEDSKATMVQESESETTKELGIPQAAVEEVNTTEELPEVPSEPVTEGKKEPELVSPSTEPGIEEENIESPKEEILVTDTVRIEVPEDFPEAIVSETKEFKEDVEVTAVTEEVHNVPETAEGDQNAVVNAEESVSIDRCPIVENASAPVKPEDNVEGETQEKAVVSEERTMSITTNNDDATQVTEISAGSGGAENVEEVREATLEGSVMQEKAVVAEEPTLSDTANVDVPTQVSVVTSDGSGGVEKIEENKEASLEGPIIQEKAVVAEEPTLSDATVSEPTTHVTELSVKCFDGAEKVEEKKTTTLEGLFMQEKVVVAEELTMRDTTESEAATQVPEVPSDETKEAILEGLLMQEKAVVAEEPTLPDTIKTEGATQVTEISSEGSGVENVEVNKEANLESSVVQSSRDQDVAVEVPQAPPEGEKASEGVEDKKDASLQSANVTLVETSRDIDTDKIVNEKSEKDEEKASVEHTKEGDEAPKVEVSAKSSHRQSSNIFSKVKHSIVKVKKAIIGKSLSSKAMPVEEKDEIKEK